MVGGEVVGEETRTFNFVKGSSSMELGANSFNTDKTAKNLFTSEKWVWTGKEEENPRLNRSSLKF